MADLSREFQIFAKPAGALCNLDCHYCYYLEKERLYPESQVVSDVRRPAGGVHRSADCDRPGKRDPLLLARRRTDCSRARLLSPDRGTPAQALSHGQAHRERHPDQRRSPDRRVVPLSCCRALRRRPQPRRSKGAARRLSRGQGPGRHTPAGDAGLSHAAEAGDPRRSALCGPCPERPAPARRLSLLQGDRGPVPQLHPPGRAPTVLCRAA